MSRGLSSTIRMVSSGRSSAFRPDAGRPPSDWRPLNDARVPDPAGRPACASALRGTLVAINATFGDAVCRPVRASATWLAAAAPPFALRSIDRLSAADRAMVGAFVNRLLVDSPPPSPLPPSGSSDTERAMRRMPHPDDVDEDLDELLRRSTASRALTQRGIEVAGSIGALARRLKLAPSHVTPQSMLLRTERRPFPASFSLLGGTQ